MKIRAAVLASMMVAAVPANAATVVTTATLDLTQAIVASNQTDFTSTAFSSISADVAKGDTWDFTVRFLNNQQISLSEIYQIWLYSLSDVGAYVTASGTLSLLDSGGNAIFTSGVKNSTEGYIHLGQFFTFVDPGGFPSSVTFSGVRYVGTVNDYSEGVITRTYNRPMFQVSARNVSFSSAVPEPATWAAMLLGLGLIGGAMRYRRRQRVNISYA